MADIVNLRRARKTRDRARAETVARENRTRFGRSRTEVASGDAEADRRDRVLDGHALHTRDTVERGSGSGEA